MTRRHDPKGTILVRRSNRDRQQAMDSLANALERCEGWRALHLEQDEVDEYGVWQLAMRVKLGESEVSV